MKVRYIFILLAAAALIAGCDKETVDAGGITVEASVGPMTKVQYSGLGTEFTAGDRIAVYAWTGRASKVPAQRTVNGEVNTFNGTVWVPEKTMEWGPAAASHFFLGVFPAPADAISDFSSVPYTVDQSDFTASDLLVACRPDGVMPSANPVQLTFNHCMARFSVDLRLRDQFEAPLQACVVTIKARQSANVNYLTGDVTPTGELTEISLPLSSETATGYTYTFSSPEVPQAGVREITVTVGGTRVFTHTTNSDIPLVAGKSTRIGLILGKDKIEVGQVAVSEWDDGSGLTGGDVDPDIIPRIRHLCSSTVQIKPGEDFTVLLWSNCPVTKNNLTLSVYSGDSDLFAIKSVEAHSTWEDVYNVTISFGTPPTPSYEATLGFIANIDGYNTYSSGFDVASSPNP